MSYIITSTTGATIATVAEGTINTSTTSLTLVGKNYTGYGALVNENFVKLLENFSHVVPPSAPMTGQLWYDSNEHVLKVYTTNYGGVWKPISSSATGAVAPVGPVTGDLWWDTANTQFKVYSGSTWVTIGPIATTTAGTSGAIAETIIDSLSASHVVVKFYISNAVIAILNKDAEFTPQTAIPGFTTIKPGLNLISSNTIAGVQFTGNVSNSYLLNGIADTQFLRSDLPITTSAMLTAAGGITVGANLTVADTSGTVSLTNSALNKDLDIYINKGGVSTKAIGINGTTGVITLTGNVSASNISASRISSTSIAGTDISATTIAGTLSTASQPNVTSVGTLTGLTMSGALVLAGDATAPLHAVTKQQLDAFTPSTATETVPGVVELATNAEAQAGTADKIIDGAKLHASSLGLSQTWQNMTASRVSGVTYTNTTGKPIQVFVVGADGAGTNPTITAVVGGLTLVSSALYDAGTGGGTAFMQFIVPNGATYSVTVTTSTISRWNELR